MGASSIILIGLSVGMPGSLIGVAAIVAVCRADKRDLVEIVRALMKMPAALTSAVRDGIASPSRDRPGKSAAGTVRPKSVAAIRQDK